MYKPAIYNQYHPLSVKDLLVDEINTSGKQVLAKNLGLEAYIVQEQENPNLPQKICVRAARLHPDLVITLMGCLSIVGLLCSVYITDNFIIPSTNPHIAMSLLAFIFMIISAFSPLVFGAYLNEWSAEAKFYKAHKGWKKQNHNLYYRYLRAVVLQEKTYTQRQVLAKEIAAHTQQLGDLQHRLAQVEQKLSFLFVENKEKAAMMQEHIRLQKELEMTAKTIQMYLHQGQELCEDPALASDPNSANNENGPMKDYLAHPSTQQAYQAFAHYLRICDKSYQALQDPFQKVMAATEASDEVDQAVIFIYETYIRVMNELGKVHIYDADDLKAKMLMPIWDLYMKATDHNRTLS